MVPGRDPEITLPGQEVQRLKSAAGDEIWTLIANMGSHITVKIRDSKFEGYAGNLATEGGDGDGVPAGDADHGAAGGSDGQPLA